MKRIFNWTFDMSSDTWNCTPNKRYSLSIFQDELRILHFNVHRNNTLLEYGSNFFSIAEAKEMAEKAFNEITQYLEEDNKPWWKRIFS